MFFFFFFFPLPFPSFSLNYKEAGCAAVYVVELNATTELQT